MSNAPSRYKYSKDGRVKFDNNTHTYWLGEKKLKGVTSWIAQYKNKFDSDYWAQKAADKEGVSKEVILQRWKEKSDTSIVNGHAVHTVFEDFISLGAVQTSEQFPKTLIAAKFIREYFQTGRLIPIACEYIIYDEEQGLASMIDCVVKNRIDEYFIIDWKTNETISRDPYGKYMLRPFNLLPDCAYYHYSLQVAKYKQICKDFPIKECFIVHIGKNDYEIIKPAKINFV